MDRRSLLKGFVATPLVAANVIPLPAPNARRLTVSFQPLDATLTALAALNYNGRAIVEFTAAGPVLRHL